MQHCSDCAKKGKKVSMKKVKERPPTPESKALGHYRGRKLKCPECNNKALV